MNIDKFKKEDGSYENSDGCFYEDAVSFLTSHCLGFCGCGMPEEALDYILDILQLIQDRGLIHSDTLTWDDWKTRERKIFPSQGSAYFAYYVLDEKGLTEHGGSVPGWLTPKGEELLSDLSEYFKKEE